jgi:hypothetical protein
MLRPAQIACKATLLKSLNAVMAVLLPLLLALLLLLLPTTATPPHQGAAA